MATHEPPATSRLVFGPEHAGLPVSAEQFAAAEFREPWKYQRAGGRLSVMSPDGYEHQNAAEPWRDALAAYRSQNRERVQHVFPNAWVRVDQENDLIGDIGVYLASGDSGVNPPDRVPDLMFEIVSEGRESHERDYVRKRDAYYRLGISEYVVIDRFTRTVTVFTRGADRFLERELGIGETYTSDLLPGLKIGLAEVMPSQGN